MSYNRYELIVSFMIHGVQLMVEIHRTSWPGFPWLAESKTNLFELKMTSPDKIWKYPVTIPVNS